MSGRTHHASLGFIAARVGLSVGPHHAIDAELSIVWEAAKVAAICPVLHRLTCPCNPYSVDGGRGAYRGGYWKRGRWVVK